MKEAKKPFTTKAVFTPAIGECEIKAGIKQLSNLRKRTNKDIENINESMKLLNTTTIRRIKEIREEIKKAQGKYDTQIDRIKRRVTRKIWQIQNRYNRKMTRTSQRFKKRLQHLHKNQAKLQKTLRHLRTEAKQCETRMQSSRRRKKEQTETQWRAR